MGIETTVETAPQLLLLVEDDAFLRCYVEETLSEQGFQLIVCEDGRKAIRELEQNCSRFSAVVTDIRLGRGPDGWEVARRARELVPAVAIVYMTGDSAAQWAAHGVPESILIQKPFAQIQLTTALATQLNQQGMAL